MTDQERVVVVRGTGKPFLQEVTIGDHRLEGDEPVAYGGTDRGPTPYDLLCAALGTCTSMTIAVYAQRKEWPLERVRVVARHAKIHAVDCEQCETKEGKLDRIDLQIELEGPLDDTQRAGLLAIAKKCPVHRTLTSEIEIRITGAG